MCDDPHVPWPCVNLQSVRRGTSPQGAARPLHPPAPPQPPRHLARADRCREQDRAKRNEGLLPPKTQPVSFLMIPSTALLRPGRCDVPGSAKCTSRHSSGLSPRTVLFSPPLAALGIFNYVLIQVLLPLISSCFLSQLLRTFLQICQVRSYSFKKKNHLDSNSSSCYVTSSFINF